MKYIKINNDGSLSENASLLNSIPIGEDIATYARVSLSDIPSDFKPGLHRVVPDTLPTLINGSWVLGLKLEIVGTEEQYNNISNVLSNTNRANRDRLLKETDWVVIKALEEGTVVSEQWKDYRKSLRDLPIQEGFPYDVVWPIKPAE